MEQTMYEDNGRNTTPLKPSFILDFNQETRSRPPIDLGLLKLASPELEKYLIHQEGSVVTAVTPTTQILFPKCVTQEQENYARGFIDALDELHRRQGIPSHVIKEEKNDDAMFYTNNGHRDYSNESINGSSDRNTNSGFLEKYHSNQHHPSNNLHSNHYTQSLNELSHANGLFFINSLNNNLNSNSNINNINGSNNKSHNLNTLHNVASNITNNNFIIINNNNTSSSSPPPPILQAIHPLLTLNNNRNINTSQSSLPTNLSTIGLISLNYNNFNTHNNLSNLNNNVNSHSNNNLSNTNSTNSNNTNNKNGLLTNPDISLNENIFSKEISPCLSPYPILPPAQTLLTRSPSNKQFQPQTTLQQQDTKPFIPTLANNNSNNNVDSQKSIYNKNPLKRTVDMAKLNQNLLQNYSNLSPSSFTTTTHTPEEHTNQTVPHLISSPPSISSMGGSPLSNSPSEESDRLEIKRARNRLAAQKCRSRKLERIAVLSHRVEELKQQNAGLELLKVGVVNSIEQLQQLLQQHSQCSTPVLSSVELMQVAL